MVINKYINNLFNMSVDSILKFPDRGKFPSEWEKILSSDPDPPAKGIFLFTILDLKDFIV